MQFFVVFSRKSNNIYILYTSHQTVEHFKDILSLILILKTSDPKKYNHPNDTAMRLSFKHTKPIVQQMRNFKVRTGTFNAVIPPAIIYCC